MPTLRATTTGGSPSSAWPAASPAPPTCGQFWRNLRDGVESISFFTEEELLGRRGRPRARSRTPRYVPRPAGAGRRQRFDAGLLRHQPAEAAITDPQQRLFLEVCWEALEHAGYAAAGYRGRVGVFGGANISTYLLRLTGAPAERRRRSSATYEVIMGNDKDALTTTVSYQLDLSGPSVAVQTVLLHLAGGRAPGVQSLRNGECELALAGGVSIRVPDRVGHLFGPGGQESPDGHCAPSTPRRGAACSATARRSSLLKRLADALRDGDHICAVIRGSAINNDGALKVGYTAPSVDGQAGVIARRAGRRRRDRRGHQLRRGARHRHRARRPDRGGRADPGLRPDTADKAVLRDRLGEDQRRPPRPGRRRHRADQDRRSRCASGEIPPTLHYTSPNPEIDFADSPFYVNAELSPWRTRDGRPRIAGVNSFGMGGTNVHVVLEEAARSRSPAAPPAGPPLPGAAASRRATPRRPTPAVRRLGEHLAAEPGARLADVAYTLQVGRKTFEHRRALVAADGASAATRSDRTAPGRPAGPGGHRTAAAGPPSCSPASASSTPAWPPSSTSASRPSAPRWTSA